PQQSGEGGSRGEDRHGAALGKGEIERRAAAEGRGSQTAGDARGLDHLRCAAAFAARRGARLDGGPAQSRQGDKSMKTLVTFGLGALTMYLLDPEHGRRRRARMREQHTQTQRAINTR